MRPYLCNTCLPGTSVGDLCKPCFQRYVENLNGRVIHLESQLQLAEMALLELNETVVRMQKRKAVGL